MIVRTVVILLWTFVSLPVVAQTRYAYFSQATNEILAIQRGSQRISAGEVRGIATRLCKTLQTLDKDNAFKRDLDRLAEASQKESAFHDQLADDLSLFVGSFGTEEADALKKAGIDERSTSQILLTAGALRTSLRKPVDASELRSNIARLREEVCRAAVAVSDTVDDEKARAQRWRRIRRWGLGIGGVSLIAADGLSSGLTLGISTASFTLGGAAVGAAIAQ